MAELSDQEIVAACARAVGIKVYELHGKLWCDFRAVGSQFYSPITDRAQAMELVEKLHLFVGWSPRSNKWAVTPHNDTGPEGYDSNLLRAICLCAACVQIEKEKNA